MLLQHQPWGAQPERTTLAWHRTVLAAVVGCVILCRLAFSELGPFAFLPLVAALPTPLAYLCNRRSAHTQDVQPTDQGSRLAGLALMVTSMCLAELVALWQ